MEDMEPVRIVHGDVVLEGSVLRPSKGTARAAIMMVPGATGPGESFYRAMRELAGEGYLVVAADMYGIEADVSNPQAAGEYFAALMQRPETLRERIVLWFETVRALPTRRTGAVAGIGYCFGGKCMLELARSGADVKAVVAFHGLLTTHAPARPGAIKARIAIWTGGKDPYAPKSDADSLLAELESAGAEYQFMMFSHAQHSFTDPDHDGFAEGIAYDPMSHRIAWIGTLAMLDEMFGL